MKQINVSGDITRRDGIVTEPIAGALVAIIDNFPWAAEDEAERLDKVADRIQTAALNGGLLTLEDADFMALQKKVTAIGAQLGQRTWLTLLRRLKDASEVPLEALAPRAVVQT